MKKKEKEKKKEERAIERARAKKRRTEEELTPDERRPAARRMLNPQLYSPNGQPLSVRGEHFLMTRTGIHGSFRVAGLPELAANGQLPLENRGRIQVRVAATPLDA